MRLDNNEENEKLHTLKINEHYKKHGFTKLPCTYEVNRTDTASSFCQVVATFDSKKEANEHRDKLNSERTESDLTNKPYKIRFTVSWF